MWQWIEKVQIIKLCFIFLLRGAFKDTPTLKIWNITAMRYWSFFVWKASLEDKQGVLLHIQSSIILWEICFKKKNFLDFLLISSVVQLQLDYHPNLKLDLLLSHAKIVHIMFIQVLSSFRYFHFITLHVGNISEGHIVLPVTIYIYLI